MKALDVMLEACSRFRPPQQATASLAGLPLSPRAQSIREELEIANKTKVETNSLLRLRQVISRLQKNYDACSVRIENTDYTAKDFAQARPNLPPCLSRQDTMIAYGSADGKLSLSVIL